MDTLVDIVSGWLVAGILAGLVIGNTALRQFPLVGSWFRWTMAGILGLMVVDMVAAVAGIEKSPTYYVYGRLLIRIIEAWGIWYCFLYQAYYGQAPLLPPSEPPSHEDRH
jgi:hypothetical protein